MVSESAVKKIECPPQRTFLGHRYGIKNGYVTVASKVLCIEGKNTFDSMHVHRDDEARIVGAFTTDLMGFYEPFPFVEQ